MIDFKIKKFPKSRLATIDVTEIGKNKHHIVGLIEIDVTNCREKIKKYKIEKAKISFTAWLMKAISITIKEYEDVASYLKGKRNNIIFNDIDISIIIEKILDGHKIPIPLIVHKVNEKSIESISLEIEDAKNKPLTQVDIVLQKKSSKLEMIYYYLPGILRKLFWNYLLKTPNFAFKKMGNVAFTSIGMMGNINGWFIPISIHPICFGIGSIVKKPIVIDDEIQIREMLCLSILFDHDVIDGANMARFIRDLCKNIKNGVNL